MRSVAVLLFANAACALECAPRRVAKRTEVSRRQVATFAPLAAAAVFVQSGPAFARGRGTQAAMSQRYAPHQHHTDIIVATCASE